MGGRTFHFGGGEFSRQYLKTQFTHKNQQYRPNHGGRRRRPMEVFRGNYSHDNTRTERSFHRLSIYVPLIFLMLLVSCG